MIPSDHHPISNKAVLISIVLTFTFIAATPRFQLHSFLNSIGHFSFNHFSPSTNKFKKKTSFPFNNYEIVTPLLFKQQQLFRIGAKPLFSLSLLHYVASKCILVFVKATTLQPYSYMSFHAASASTSATTRSEKQISHVQHFSYFFIRMISMPFAWSGRCVRCFCSVFFFESVSCSTRMRNFIVHSSSSIRCCHSQIEVCFTL